jgi:hypothetical protein
VADLWILGHGGHLSTVARRVSLRASEDSPHKKNRLRTQDVGLVLREFILCCEVRRGWFRTSLGVIIGGVSGSLGKARREFRGSYLLRDHPEVRP